MCSYSRESSWSSGRCLEKQRLGRTEGGRANNIVCLFIELYALLLASEALLALV